MNGKSRQELYGEFMDFVKNYNQRERYLVNQRMLSVFFWCFFLPALISATLYLLVTYKVLPHSVKTHLDMVILIFPVLYSLYFLGSQVLADVPAAFRRGSIATTLGQSLKESIWRDDVCKGLAKSVHARPDDWKWIASSFRMDLKRLQYRNGYLTVLAGAVFFLIMQGIDYLTDDVNKVTLVKEPLLGWVEMSNNNLTQFVGLGLFLILLYLSGTQTRDRLQRYLDCAELMVLEKPTT